MEVGRRRTTCGDLFLQLGKSVLKGVGADPDNIGCHIVERVKCLFWRGAANDCAHVDFSFLVRLVLSVCLSKLLVFYHVVIEGIDGVNTTKVLRSADWRVAVSGDLSVQ